MRRAKCLLFHRYLQAGWHILWGPIFGFSAGAWLHGNMERATGAFWLGVAVLVGTVLVNLVLNLTMGVEDGSTN